MNKPLEMNVELWRYILWLAGQPREKLTKTQAESLAFWDKELSNEG
jgi:hypothetical protein